VPLRSSTVQLDPNSRAPSALPRSASLLRVGRTRISFRGILAGPSGRTTTVPSSGFESRIAPGFVGVWKRRIASEDTLVDGARNPRLRSPACLARESHPKFHEDCRRGAAFAALAAFFWRLNRHARITPTHRPGHFPRVSGKWRIAIPSTQSINRPNRVERIDATKRNYIAKKTLNGQRRERGPLTKRRRVQ